jgi:hypothetical protein
LGFWIDLNTFFVVYSFPPVAPITFIRSMCTGSNSVCRALTICTIIYHSRAGGNPLYLLKNKESSSGFSGPQRARLLCQIPIANDDWRIKKLIGDYFINSNLQIKLTIFSSGPSGGYWAREGIYPANISVPIPMEIFGRGRFVAGFLKCAVWFGSNLYPWWITFEIFLTVVIYRYYMYLKILHSL